jgi:uncharacterized membrane protein YoaK (UPF0700 family)
MLCLTAGFVNVGGFISFSVLTTNVTGHVAIFADKLSQRHFDSARVVGFWMFMFLLGAFFSSLWLNKVGKNKRYAYTVPILAEATILLLVAYFGKDFDKSSLVQTEVFAGSLLFAMGMQNALVSVISGSVVRTTHLTGMFTDLAIDLSRLTLPNNETRQTLRPKIILKLVIISFFFLGGILGGYLYQSLRFHIFIIPAGILFFVMFYDLFRIRTIKMIRRVKRDMTNKFTSTLPSKNI